MTTTAGTAACPLVMQHWHEAADASVPQANGPVIRRHRLGAELRRLREACALRLEDAAGELGVAASTLSRIETGHAPARTSYVRILLELYHVSDPAEHRRLTDLAREGQRKPWWASYDRLLPSGMADYLGLETASAVSRSYALQTIPALLQTSDYAIAACRATRPDLARQDIELLAEVTRRRQEVLSYGHRVHAVIDESALLRSVGTPSIMAAQLVHLRDVAASHSTTVQILALSGPRSVLSAPFTVLSFPDPADPDVACRVGPDGQVALIKRGTTVSAQLSSFDALTSAAMPADESANLISAMARSR